MTKHCDECNFEEKVQAGFCAGTGDGEISGTAKFGLDDSGVSNYRLPTVGAIQSTLNLNTAQSAALNSTRIERTNHGST